MLLSRKRRQADGQRQVKFAAAVKSAKGPKPRDVVGQLLKLVIGLVLRPDHDASACPQGVCSSSCSHLDDPAGRRGATFIDGQFHILQSSAERRRTDTRPLVSPQLLAELRQAGIRPPLQDRTQIAACFAIDKGADPLADGLVAMPSPAFQRHNSFCTNERLTPNSPAISSRVAGHCSQASIILNRNSSEYASMLHLRPCSIHAFPRYSNPKSAL
jgi:hypothetical protein